MTDIKAKNLVDSLWQWFSTKKDRPVIKDSTSIYNMKFDGYFDSSVSDPLSFSVFELSDKSELIIEDIGKLIESQAAYFFFVNQKTGWIVAIKNTPANVTKLGKGEAIQNLKIKVIN